MYLPGHMMGLSVVWDPDGGSELDQKEECNEEKTVNNSEYWELIKAQFVKFIM